MTKNRPQTTTLAGSRFFPAIIGALLLCIALVIPAARAADPPPESPISSVPPRLLDSFSIFRSPSEVVPPEIAQALASLDEPTPLGQGYNVALGQEVVLPGNHAPLWAVPGRNYVMLLKHPRNGVFGGTSTTIARAVKRGVVFWSPVPRAHDPRLMHVKGLVPDGVTGVRLSKAAVAPVVDNAFTRKVDQARFWEKWVFLREPLATIDA